MDSQEKFQLSMFPSIDFKEDLSSNPLKSTIQFKNIELQNKVLKEKNRKSLQFDELMMCNNGDLEDKNNWKSLILKKQTNTFLQVKMKRLIQKVIQRARNRIQQKISASQIKMIDDKSHFSIDLKPKKNKSLFSIFSFVDRLVKLSKLNSNSKFQWIKFDKLVNVMDINNPIKIVLSVLNSFTVLFIFFIFSISICFKSKINNITSINWIFVFFSIQIINIVFTLNSSFYQNGAVITSRKLILISYAKKNLLIDLMSFFSIIFFLLFDQYISSQRNYSISISTIKIVIFFPFLFKLKDINLSFKLFQDQFLINQNINFIFQIVQLLSIFILINHLLSCLWIFNYESITQDDFSEWNIFYIKQFYFCILGMTAVGYENSSHNSSQYVILISILTIQIGVFGFIINQLNQIFSQFYAQEIELNQKQKIINEWMKKMQISRSLQSKITKNLEQHYFLFKSLIEFQRYSWKKKNENLQLQNSDLFEDLSQDLKQQICINQNKIIMSFLGKYFSQEFIEKIIFYSQQNHLKPQQIIYEEQDEDINLYVIKSGKVEIFINQHNFEKNKILSKQIQVLEEGEILGISEFFKGEKLKYNIKSLEFGNLQKISRNDFISVLQEFPRDTEKFHYIKDQFIFSGESAIFEDLCHSCRSKGHTILTCPSLHLKIDKQNFIITMSSKMNAIQEIREKINRSKNKKLRKYNFASENEVQQIFQQLILNDSKYQKMNKQISSSDLSCNVTSPNISIVEAISDINKDCIPSQITLSSADKKINTEYQFINSNIEEREQSNSISLSTQNNYLFEQISPLNRRNTLPIISYPFESSPSLKKKKNNGKPAFFPQNFSNIGSIPEVNELSKSSQLIISKIGGTKSSKSKRKQKDSEKKDDNTDLDFFQGLDCALSNTYIKNSSENTEIINDDLANFYDEMLYKVRKMITKPQSNSQKIIDSEQDSYGDEMDLIFEKFDKFQNYLIYYPSNNLNFILQNFQSSQRRISQMKKSNLSPSKKKNSSKFFHFNHQNVSKNFLSAKKYRSESVAFQNDKTLKFPLSPSDYGYKNSTSIDYHSNDLRSQSKISPSSSKIAISLNELNPFQNDKMISNINKKSNSSRPIFFEVSNRKDEAENKEDSLFHSPNINEEPQDCAFSCYKDGIQVNETPKCVSPYFINQPFKN